MDIQPGAVIAKRVRFYQAVTLGAKSFPQDENGYLVKGKPRHPIVQDEVVIYTGADGVGEGACEPGFSSGLKVQLDLAGEESLAPVLALLLPDPMVAR